MAAIAWMLFMIACILYFQGSPVDTLKDIQRELHETNHQLDVIAKILSGIRQERREK